MSSVCQSRERSLLVTGCFTGKLLLLKLPMLPTLSFWGTTVGMFPIPYTGESLRDAPLVRRGMLGEWWNVLGAGPGEGAELAVMTLAPDRLDLLMICSGDPATVRAMDCSWPTDGEWMIRVCSWTAFTTRVVPEVSETQAVVGGAWVTRNSCPLAWLITSLCPPPAVCSSCGDWPRFANNTWLLAVVVTGPSDCPLQVT